MKKVFIFSLIFASAFLSTGVIFAYPEHVYAIAPTVSIGTGNGNTPENTGPAHESVLSGSIPVYATVTDPELESYHFRVVKDGGVDGYTCLDSDALFAEVNQGYASTTLSREACGFNFNQSVYFSPNGFTNMLIATLNADDLIAFGGEGDYWFILGGADTYGNRTHENYLEDPKIKVTINSTAPVSTTTTETSTGGGGSGGNGGGGGNNSSTDSTTSTGSSNGGSGGGNGPIVGAFGVVGGGSGVSGTNAGEVLGASTGGCDEYLTSYIRTGGDNDTEQVLKLQSFLRDFEGFTSVNLTGVYDEASLSAVHAFQTRYMQDIMAPWKASRSSGFVYLTTRKKINEIYCKFAVEFPLTPAQLEEIANFKPKDESSVGESFIESKDSVPGSDANQSEEGGFWEGVGNFFENLF